MSVRRRRAARALVTAGVCLVAAAIPAAAIPAASAPADDSAQASGQASGQAKKIHITGLLTLTDSKRGIYAASGDLEGTWRIPPTQAVDYYNTKTVIIQKGTESFRGCLEVGRGRCGTLTSEYISWTYQRRDGRLLSGGCAHAPTGGTEGFRGVRGLIMMTDTPVGDDQVNTVYQGELILDAVQEEPKSAPTTTSRSAATAANATSAC